LLPLFLAGELFARAIHAALLFRVCAPCGASHPGEIRLADAVVESVAPVKGLEFVFKVAQPERETLFAARYGGGAPCAVGM
jgi:hypothetical protein